MERELGVEKVLIFKNYFPNNNVDAISKRKHHVHHRYKKKEIHEINKLSQYAFNAEFLYEMQAKKESFVGNSRFRTRKTNESKNPTVLEKGKKGISLEELVRKVMASKEMKEKIRKEKYIPDLYEDD